MATGALPFLIAEPVENLCARLPRPAHGLDRGLDWPVPGESSRELGLVVAAEERIVLGDQPAQADRRHHLAVGQVMRNLPRRPFAASRPIELFFADVPQGLGHGFVTCPVPGDQLLPLFNFQFLLPC
jgi:hypothetical protein